MAKKTLAILTFSFLAFFAGLGTVAAEEINKEFHQSFDVKKGDSLSLRFGDGNVQLIPWEKNIIDVKVRYRADIYHVGIRLARNQDFGVEFRQTANTVYVVGKEPSSAAIGFYNKKVYEYVYEIHSPDYVALELDGDDGNVDIENWAAEIDCRIDDGDIHLRNIVGGKTQIWGEDGNLEIAHLSGDLTIEVDDGDVNLTACDMKNCRVGSEDGNITISQSKGSYDLIADDGDIVMKKIEAKGLNINTADGDVDVDLLAAETLDADIKTDDGNINIDLEKRSSVSFYVSANDADSIRIEIDNIENSKEDKYTKSGSINGGTGRLKIQTADGDVTIKERL
jgi:DUF4097 and DUF4098 domain-containing protein YvlB